MHILYITKLAGVPAPGREVSALQEQRGRWASDFIAPNKVNTSATPTVHPRVENTTVRYLNVP